MLGLPVLNNAIAAEAAVLVFNQRQARVSSQYFSAFACA
jgi:hypothetical protein